MTLEIQKIPDYIDKNSINGKDVLPYKSVHDRLSSGNNVLRFDTTVNVVDENIYVGHDASTFKDKWNPLKWSNDIKPYFSSTPLSGGDTFPFDTGLIKFFIPPATTSFKIKFKLTSADNCGVCFRLGEPPDLIYEFDDKTILNRIVSNEPVKKNRLKIVDHYYGFSDDLYWYFNMKIDNTIQETHSTWLYLYIENRSNINRLQSLWTVDQEVFTAWYNSYDWKEDMWGIMPNHRCKIKQLNYVYSVEDVISLGVR